MRYLNHAVVGLLNNSEGKVKTAQSRDAEYKEANGTEPPLYDRFCHRIGEEKDAAKAAFMSRFVWQRKDAGYTLNRLHVKRDPTRKSDVKKIRTAQIEAKREALKAAPRSRRAMQKRLRETRTGLRSRPLRWKPTKLGRRSMFQR